MSIIWRGALIWRTFEGRETGRLQLGSHQERLRQYLVGTGPYPQGVVVKISVASDCASREFTEFPWHNPAQPDATLFTFATRGIWFDIALGDALPEYMYQSCCMSSPEKPIFLRDFHSCVDDGHDQFTLTARIDAKLQSA